MTPQPKRSETAHCSMDPNDIASDYRSVLESAPARSATDPHDPTRDLAVLSRPLPHPTNKTRSAFDVPGPEAPPPFGSQPGPAFSTPLVPLDIPRFTRLMGRLSKAQRMVKWWEDEERRVLARLRIGLVESIETEERP